MCTTHTYDKLLALCDEESATSSLKSAPRRRINGMMVDRILMPARIVSSRINEMVQGVCSSFVRWLVS